MISISEANAPKPDEKTPPPGRDDAREAVEAPKPAPLHAPYPFDSREDACDE